MASWSGYYKALMRFRLLAGLNTENMNALSKVFLGSQEVYFFGDWHLLNIYKTYWKKKRSPSTNSRNFTDLALHNISSLQQFITKFNSSFCTPLRNHCENTLLQILSRCTKFISFRCSSHVSFRRSHGWFRPLWYVPTMWQFLRLSLLFRSMGRWTSRSISDIFNLFFLGNTIHGKPSRSSFKL